MLTATTYNPLQTLRFPALEARLAQLHAAVTDAQVTYRNTGLRFHSLSPETRIEPANNSYVQIFLDIFTVRDSRPTPEMVLVLQDVLRMTNTAKANLRSASTLYLPREAERRTAALAGVEAAIDEAETLLMSLQLDFAALERGIRELESRQIVSGVEHFPRHEDDAALQAWAATLPVNDTGMRPLAVENSLSEASPAEVQAMLDAQLGVMATEAIVSSDKTPPATSVTAVPKPAQGDASTNEHSAFDFEDRAILDDFMRQTSTGLPDLSSNSAVRDDFIPQRTSSAKSPEGDLRHENHDFDIEMPDFDHSMMDVPSFDQDLGGSFHFGGNDPFFGDGGRDSGSFLQNDFGAGF